MIRRMLGRITWRGWIAVAAMFAWVALTWLQAPKIGYDGRLPFESRSARGWLIAAILGACALVVLVRYAMKAARGVRIVWPGTPLKQQAQEPLEEPSSREGVAAVASEKRHQRQTEEREPDRAMLAALRRSFDAALAALCREPSPMRPVRLGRWRAARARPWYFVIGAPESGKTALLEASGLRFARLRAAASPPDCDVPYRWWLAEQAVLIESAATGGQADSQWDAFLGMVRKVRGSAAANGIIVAVDTRLLRDGTAPEREAHAAMVRERIDAVYRAFGLRVPIYLVVTQCDRLAGFGDFFDDLGDDERAQIFGATCTEEGGAPGAQFALRRFGDDFDTLVRRLNARTVERMPLRNDPQRSAAIYGFPSRFAALREPLQRFIGDAFDALPYRCDPLVRGVYFTAADFGRAGGTMMGNAAARGYFVRRMLQDAVLPDAFLAAANRLSPHRQQLARRGLAATIATAALALAACFVVSYARNRAVIEEFDMASHRLTGLAREGVTLDDPTSMLPLLDAARDLPRGEVQRELHVPLLFRFGLDESTRLGELARSRYRSLLRETLQRFVALRLEQALRAPRIDAADRYALLRIYLMLGDPSHFDSAAVLAWVASDAQTLPLSDVQRGHWLKHAAVLFDPAGFKADVPLDARAIHSARAELTGVPAAERLIQQIMPRLTATIPETLSVVDMAGQNAPLVFYRKSGQRFSDGIAGAYTLEGYRRYLVLRDEALARAGAEDWVMGPSTSWRAAGAAADESGNKKQSKRQSEGESRALLAGEVDRRYFERYISAWDALLTDLALRPLPRAADGAAIAKMLAQGNSPLRRLLVVAAQQTTLDAGPANINVSQARSFDAGQGVLDNASTAVKSTSRPVSRLFALSARVRAALSGATPARSAVADVLPAPQASQPTLVDRHFEELHRLVASSGQSSPLDQLQQQLAEAGVFLDAAAAARESGLKAPPGDALQKLKDAAVGLPAPLSSIVQGVSADGVLLASRDERDRLNKLWRSTVAPFCHAATDGRYPFVKTSNVDVTIDDFARLFRPGGLIDGFFKDNLQDRVDTSTTPWSWRAGGELPGVARDVLAQFMKATAIRDAFFPDGGKTMSVRFSLRPRSMDPALTRLVLSAGATKLDYAHDPPRSVTFSWPGQAAEHSARIDVQPADGDERGALEASGPWALFRLLGMGRLKPRHADSLDLDFDLGGRNVSLTLEAASVVNPFTLDALSRFRCLDGL